MMRVFGRKAITAGLQATSCRAFPASARQQLSRGTSECRSANNFVLLSRRWLYAARFSSTASAAASDNDEKVGALKRLALSGDVTSAAELGRILLDASHIDARHWLELAAESNSVESQYLLGVYLNDHAAGADGSADNSNASAVAKAAAAANEEREVSQQGREQVLREIDDAKKEARRKRKERLGRARRNVHSPSLSAAAVISTSDQQAAQPLSDAELCVYWLRAAARAGHGPAMTYLGNVLLNRHRAGSALADGQEALLWYQKAANLPTPQADALFNLGTLCFSGQPGLVEVDLPKSLAFFLQGAQCGDPGCMFWVGHCFLTGEGGAAEVSVEKGLLWLSKAADEDHPSAHYHLAMAHRSGLAKVEESEILFLRHLHAAADLGDGDSLFYLADMHLDQATSQDVSISTSNPDGDRAAQAAEGISYLHRAVAAGHVDATVTLGALFYAGKLLPQDKRRAFELYNTAAEQGSKEAWRNLASMYFLGDGVPKSEEIAREIMKTIFNKGEGSISRPEGGADQCS